MNEGSHTSLFFSLKPIHSVNCMIEKISIVQATDEDYNSLFSLKKLHLLEEGIEQKVSVENLRRYALDSKDKRFNVIVAKLDKDVIAYSIYSYQYSSIFDTSSLFISDLYVSPPYRNQGIAKKIIAKLSESEDCLQLVWKVLKTNATAIDLYQKAGAIAEFENEKIISCLFLQVT
jgi:ribosomal protein S18 acetylase RimI-like enzyme